MENLCTSCLCSGRKLYFLSDTGFEHLYLQIINEIAIYNKSDLCVRICWECKALLLKMQKFKEQVKTCYVELLQHVQQNNFEPFSNMSRLQVHQNYLLSCPELTESYPDVTVKNEMETISFIDDGIPYIDDNASMNYDDDETLVKTEDQHCEPESFVKNLNLDMINKEKSGRKGDNHTKRKSKKNKLKVKKEKVLKKKTKVRHKSSSIDMDEVNTEKVDTTETDCYEKKENNEEQNAEILDGVKFDKVTENKAEKKIISRNCKIKKELPKLVSEPISERPICIECGKTFSSRKTYRYHLNVLHRGQNRYPCPRCGKVYQWKSNLGRHIRSHKARDSGELYCEICDKRFASVATYRQHLKISRRHVSESEFTFICNECDKRFVNKTRLRDHIDWEHLNKIKFKCQVCNKPYKCHTSLYVHMQNVHRSKDKKDNLCHVCGKSYQNAAKLKYHIVAMHTSETPYQCDQCNAAFGWNSSLYRHIREVHYKLKVRPKNSKKQKKLEVLPSLLPVLPTMHHSGPV